MDAFQDNPSQTQLEVQLITNRAAHGVVSGSKEVRQKKTVAGGRFD